MTTLAKLGPMAGLVLVISFLCAQESSALDDQGAATMTHFLCGGDRCSIERQEYCHASEKRCRSCEQDMGKCGTSKMKLMRKTCLIYCVHELQKRNMTRERKASDLTFTSKIKELQRENTNLQLQMRKVARERKASDLTFTSRIKELQGENTNLLAISIAGGVVSLICVLVFIVFVIKIYCRRSRDRGSRSIKLTAEEEGEPLTKTETGNPEPHTKASVEDDFFEDRETSSGVSSELTTPSGSKEQLGPATAKAVPLFAGLDGEGHAPQQSQTPDCSDATASKVTKGSRPSTGRGFSELPDGMGTTDDQQSGPGQQTVSLGGQTARWQQPERPSPAPTAPTVPTAPTAPDLQPGQCACPQSSQAPLDGLGCLRCRAQDLPHTLGMSQPSPASPSRENSSPGCSLGQKAYDKISSVCDTAPNGSVFTPA